jgi:hypothetical protein
MMTFEKLREGGPCNSNGEECECLEFDNLDENYTDHFARRIETDELADEDFASFYELRAVMRIKTCRDECKYRGVSVHKLSGNDRDAVMEKLRLIRSVSPKGFPPHYCEFTISDDGGLIWDTTSEPNPTHYTLFKCDEFDLDCVKVVSIGPL